MNVAQQTDRASFLVKMTSAGAVKKKKKKLHKLGALCVQRELERDLCVGVCCAMKGEIKASACSWKW